MSAAQPGRWEQVRTQQGWHARLVGANGEIVLTSEVYTDPRTAQRAVEIARESGGLDIAEVDERTSDSSALVLDVFDTRLSNGLRRNGLKTLRDVSLLAEADLRRIRNFGAASVAAVKAKLADAGLALAERPRDPEFTGDASRQGQVSSL